MVTLITCSSNGNWHLSSIFCCGLDLCFHCMTAEYLHNTASIWLLVVSMYWSLTLLFIVLDSRKCSYGGIRLLGGSNQYDGRVEVCINDQWGTVCSDFWGGPDASVVCKQLGYSYTGSELAIWHIILVLHWNWELNYVENINYFCRFLCASNNLRTPICCSTTVVRIGFILQVVRHCSMPTLAREVDR